MAQVTFDAASSEIIIRSQVNTAGTLSPSGKSMVLDSTHGFANVATGYGVVRVGLNVITTDDNWTGGKRNGQAQPAKPSLVKAGQPGAVPAK